MNDFNRTLSAKAGAIVLANGQPQTRTNGDPVLLAYQRYGRGRAMAFTSDNSWTWQMGMDSKDQTYQLFWKQIMRWLVAASPDPVMLTTDKDTYLPGESVSLRADVADKSFNRMNNAKVFGKVTDPDGNTEPIAFDWTGSQDGTYQAQINSGGTGVYQVQLDATVGTESLGNARAAFQVEDRPVEFYNAALDQRLLENVASQTGGHYYPLSKMGDVPDDAQYVEGASSFIEQKELWDVPFLFVLLCLTLSGEWFWRKRKGLA